MKSLHPFLRSPDDHAPLEWRSDRLLNAKDQTVFEMCDGVYLAQSPLGNPEDPSRSVREFYQAEGWAADEAGLFTDTKAYVDTRPTALAFTRRCIARLGRHFERGGDLLLDAGSGAIPHQELLDYSSRYERRVCVDLAPSALRAAKAKLGKRGICVQGDITNLPIETGTMDAVTCNHVIYLIPAEKQRDAFLEMWRVLKPGGFAVIVYWWPYAPLLARLQRWAERFGSRGAAAEAIEAFPTMYHHYHSRAWFEEQDWPFRYRYDIYRIVDNAFLRDFVSDDWRGRSFLEALYALQVCAPAFCGRHGVMPAIVIRKD